MPKVSVIIPVYNAQKYIIKCIDSLINQTLDELEVILVDDHGEDDSIKLVKKYIDNHPRKDMFRFSETHINSGPGEARNVGLKMARGEYVAFVDSDDWVEADMYLDLYKAAKVENADICYSDAWQEDLNKKTSHTLKNPLVAKGDFTYKDKAYFLTHYVAYFWTFIYKREFLNKNAIKFPPEKSAEDSYFIACSVLCASRVSNLNMPFYHYIVRPDSLSNKENNGRVCEKQQVFKRLFDFAGKKNLYTPFQKELEYIYIKKAFVTAVIDYLGDCKNPKKEVLSEMIKDLKQQVPDYKYNYYYRKRTDLKLILFILNHFPLLGIKTFPFIIKKINH